MRTPNPHSRRSRIREAFQVAKGDLEKAADILGVSPAVARMWVQKDVDLAREIALPRKRKRRINFFQEGARGSTSRRTGIDDAAPIAHRRLTLREMRDAGIWVPLKDDEEKRSDP